MREPRGSGLLSREACKELARLAGTVSPGLVIVEIGVYKGRSAAWLAYGARPGVKVYGIDPWDKPGQDAYDDMPKKREKFTAKKNIHIAMVAAKHYGIILIKNFSVNVAATWNDLPVGLLFIDGDHRAESARADYLAWEPHLADHALVVWDDYRDSHPGVVEAVDGLVSDGKITKPDVVASRLAITKHVAGSSENMLEVRPETSSHVE